MISRSFISFLLFIIQSSPVILAAESDKKTHKSSINIKSLLKKNEFNLFSGTEIHGSIGKIADPSVLTGLTLSFQGGLGAISRSKTINYDAYSTTVKWKPGGNWLGKMINVIGGFSSWFLPSLSSVYSGDYLSNEDKLEDSIIENAFVVGLSFTLGSRELNTLNINENEILEKYTGPANDEDAIRSYLWKKVYRDSLRRPILLFGSTFRAGSIGTDVVMDAVDLYLGAAVGYNIMDIAFSGHFILPTTKSFIAKYAVSSSLAVFFDLRDSPPSGPSNNILKLGLTYSYGYYMYQPIDEINFPAVLPITHKHELILTLAGIPIGTKETNQSISIRIGNYSHRYRKDKTIVSLVLSIDLLAMFTKKEEDSPSNN